MPQALTTISQLPAASALTGAEKVPMDQVTTATITMIAVASNAATITTSAAHGFTAGNTNVAITGLTNTFLNGNFTVSSVPTSTTFTVAVVHGNVSNTSDSGTATATTTARTAVSNLLANALPNPVQVSLLFAGPMPISDADAWGADPTGVADSSPAFNAINQYMVSQGIRCYGIRCTWGATYSLHSKVVLGWGTAYSQVFLFGQGCTFTDPGGSNKILIQLCTLFACTLQDFTIVGDGSGGISDGKTGIQLLSYSDITNISTSGNTVTVTTLYPHGFSAPSPGATLVGLQSLTAFGLNDVGIQIGIATVPSPTTFTFPFSLAWQKCIYANSLFVAVATNGTGNGVVYSSDGETWINAAPVSDSSWNAVAYGNGVWVAAGGTGNNDGCAMKAATPAGPWTSSAIPYTDMEIEDVDYDGTTFVAVAGTGATARCMTCADAGVTWVAQTLAELNEMTSVCAVSTGVFVACSGSGTHRFQRTTNSGVTWTGVSAAAQNTMSCVRSGGGVLLACSEDGTNRLQKSTDGGQTWTAISLDLHSWSSLAYLASASIWILSSYDGTIYYSPDLGVTWHSGNGIGGQPINTCAAGAGVFVAMGFGLTGAESSPDGNTWTARNAGLGTSSFAATGLCTTNLNGTYSSRVVIRNVLVQYMYNGVSGGDDVIFNGQSVSELECDALAGENCYNRLSVEGPNTVDIWDNNLAADNVTWVATTNNHASGYHANNGSYSNCVNGFFLETGGSYSIRGIRSEQTTGIDVKVASTGLSSVSLVIEGFQFGPLLYSITGASADGVHATLNLSGSPPYSVGDFLTVMCLSNTAFNGRFAITSISGSAVSYALAKTISSSSATGNVTTAVAVNCSGDWNVMLAGCNLGGPVNLSQGVQGISSISFNNCTTFDAVPFQVGGDGPGIRWSIHGYSQADPNWVQNFPDGYGIVDSNGFIRYAINPVQVYAGDALAGNGLMVCVGHADISATGSSVTATTLFTPPADGEYLLTATIATTQAGTAGVAQLAAIWTDENGSNSLSIGGTLNLATLGAFINVMLNIHAKTTAPIQFEVTVTGATGTPLYVGHVNLIRLS